MIMYFVSVLYSLEIEMQHTVFITHQTVDDNKLATLRTLNKLVQNIRITRVGSDFQQHWLPTYNI